MAVNLNEDGMKHDKEKAKGYFIRPTGKGALKIYQLISIEDFEMLYVFFDTEEEAREYAHKNALNLVNF
jgi:hypothetical protein